MVAFSIGTIHVYRYGIFYAIAFLAGYGFFTWVVKKNVIKSSFPRIHEFLQTKLDVFMLYIFLGVLIGGRLGHVLIYSGGYYREHPLEIVQVWK